MQDSFENILSGACRQSERALGVPEGSLGASVGGADFDSSSGCLNIHLDMNFIMPHGIYENMARAVSESLECISSASFTAQYQCGGMNTESIVRQYLPYIIDSDPELSGLARTIDPEHMHFSEGRIVFEVFGRSVLDELKRKNAGPAMAGRLRDKFGIEVEIDFCNCDHSKYEEKLKNRKEKEAEELRQNALEAEQAAKAAAVRQQEEAAAQPYGGPGGYGGWQQGYSQGERPQRRKRSYEGPVEGNRILGRPVNGECINIKEISEDDGNICIEGSVFDKDERVLKSGRVLKMLDITDGTDSIRVKCFVSPQKSEDIDEHVPKGTYIKLAGHTEYDTFEKSTVFMADSIEKSEKPGRRDTCDRKRVELHVHTKMSQVDAVMDVKDLVKTAKKWGHKAVAVTDHGVVQSFPDAAEEAGDDIKVIYGCEGYMVNTVEKPDGTVDYKTNPPAYTKGNSVRIDRPGKKKKDNSPYHIIILAKNQTGLKNLYKLVSRSYLDYYYKKPRMPKKLISEYREGLIIGSACVAGELFQAMIDGAQEAEIEEIASFYDYLEVQPRTNNKFMLESEFYNVNSMEELLDFDRRIVALGEKLNKPVVATSDAHYLNPEDYIYRNIIQAAHGYSPENLPEEPRLWLRTTDEMLEEFSYLGPEKAEEIVIDNPQKVADSIDVLKPVPDEKCPPHIDGAEEKLRTHCYERAHEIYGDPLPQIVEERLEKELTSIIGNGYAVMYVIADELVQRSMKRGYLVGSRGSVGSSFAATMDGITEVNPLPPHYVCPKCKHSEFILDSEYDCGVDMPDKVCPVCGTKYKKDGFNIPFQTFLGFNGDKEPDIDLNFSGQDQREAHKDVGRIFGEKNVFKAGTIGTIQEKTAFGYVKKYFEERGRTVSPVEMKRLALGCTGVHKSNGQHPGGIVVLPKGHEIEEFCPVMHPSKSAGKEVSKDEEIITTHFDYHKIDKNLLKLDILGHDVPTMIRMFQDMTGVAPEDIPLDDPKVNSLFLNTDALDIKMKDYSQTHGTFGIPEFGTPFTRGMLDETKPKKFSALVRIAGFSHGTDVWVNNAQEFIRSGQATMDDAIATRDDIMNYLIGKGLPKKEAFQIMEKVRKGKGLTEEREALMREHDVPEWYIESCKRIKYMFPKAHAVAYVMMSYRIAYFKVYYPPEFYAVHFTIKIDAFNADVILGGVQSVLDRMDAVHKMGRDATQKEKDELPVYEVAYEMYARGYEFLPVRFGHSKGTEFSVENGKVRLPFRALEGMGETAAQSIEDAYNDREFSSVEDLISRTSANSSNVETLREHGVLDGIPESDQMSLFDLAACGA